MTQPTARVIAGSIIATAGLMCMTTPAQAAPQVVAERGFVAECTGVAGGYSATVSLYQNSSVEVAPTATVETADGTVFAGEGTTAGDVFDEGTVDVTFELSDLETQPPVPAGSASLSGSYTLAGSPTRVHQTLRDNGYIVVITGTNILLSTNFALEYAGTSIPLTCDPAFAFDLTTRRQPIGNA
jgi:hypothetical protein